MDGIGQFLEQLRQYEPADELERAHQRQLIELLSVTPEPFARTTFAPGHITASCFIIDGSGRLLLHHHRRLGRWLQMGGHLEQGESPRDAALREGIEESGLEDLAIAVDTILDLDVHRIPAGRGEPSHHHFDVRFLGRTQRPDAITIDDAESTDLRWATLDEAAALMGSAESMRVMRKISGVLCAS
jgi:8-oxo-dGTP pyrophosphatase MutT (NUDIX family)